MSAYILRTSASLIATLCLFATPCSLFAAERLNIGDLSLEWPDGYTSERVGEALLLRGPNDERITVSYLGGGNHFPRDQRERFSRMHRTFAFKTLDTVAANHGSVVARLNSIRDADDTIYSTASRMKHAASESYYLQYFVVGRFSVALFRVEATVEAVRQKIRFDAVFSSARWSEVQVTRRLR